jgi:outer membrane protein
MKNRKCSNIQKLWVCLCLVALTVVVPGFQSLDAQELSQRNWSLWLGGGALMEPVYSGSDKLLANPIPFIQAEYTTPYMDFFAGMENGIGVTLKETEFTGLNLTIGISPVGLLLEKRRDPDLDKVENFVLDGADELKEFLQGTPTLKNTIEVFGTVGLELPFGKVSSTATFFPVKADYDDASLSDKDYDGITVSIDFETGLPLTPQIFLQGGSGVTWMNEKYAEAFHGVLYPTTRLDVFKAKSGVSDVHASVVLVSFFTEHVGALVIGSVTLLLDDAADSPLTKEEFQPQMGAVVFYNF